MIKTKKIRNIIVFILLFFFTDLILTQLFLKKIYYEKLEEQYISDLDSRVHNKNYKYTFAKKKSFKSIYTIYDYTIHTNNLGFRDYKVRDIDKNKNYIIVIGDSFVESVALDYENTLVGHLNKKNKVNNIKVDEFLNAGVVSYSSYIYLKKIKTILEENSWLNVEKFILLLDKSDVADAVEFFHRPEYFPVEENLHSVKRKDLFIYDLKKGYFWRFYYKQTTTGAFLKKIGDFVELKIKNLRDRYKLSKKLQKNFREVSSKEINALRSINTRSDISILFKNDLWEQKAMKSIDFAVQNLSIIKNFLDKKNVGFLVVIFPWPYEIVNIEERENYINYITPKLKASDIDFVSAYEHFLKGDPYLTITENYIYNDIHFNDNGNKLLSDIIWSKIANN